MPPQVIKKVGPYIENPDFTPKMIEKASVACKAICMCDRGVPLYSCPSHFHESGFFVEFGAVRTASQHTAAALSRSLSDGHDGVDAMSRRWRGGWRHAIEPTARHRRV